MYHKLRKRGTAAQCINIHPSNLSRRIQAHDWPLPAEAVRSCSRHCRVAIVAVGLTNANTLVCAAPSSNVNRPRWGKGGVERSVSGIVLVVLASACFASAGLFVQFAGSDASSWVTVFASLAVGGTVVLPLAFLRLGGLSGIATPHPWLQIARGIVSVLAIGALFAALGSIPLTDGMLLRETAPLWIPILSAILLGEPMPPRIWPAIVMGFAGVAMVLHPRLDHLALGDLFGLASGLLYAVQTILTRHLDRLNEPQARTLFYIYAITISASFTPAASTFAPLAGITVVWLVVGGVLLLASTGCLIAAYQTAPAWLIAPIGYTAVVFAALVDWLVLNKVPHPEAALGMALVILSGILIVVLGRQGDRQTSAAAGRRV
jgi:drug/metabolite transporter (DMT)-like permease